MAKVPATAKAKDRASSQAVNTSAPNTRAVNSMAADALRNSGLARVLTSLFADISDLIQKEIRLARAELTQKLASRLQAGVWLGVAGALGLIAALLVSAAIVFAVASLGLALHWACLLVAAFIAAAAAFAFFHGRSLAEDPLLPKRSVRQISADIETAKEQLT